MSRRTLFMFVIAVLAAIIGLLHFLPHHWNDAALGFAVGFGIAALVTWLGERGANGV